MVLSNEEMLNVKGGAFKLRALGAVIGGLIVFAIGVIDGQIKLKWQNRKNTEFKGNSEGKPLIQIRRKD